MNDFTKEELENIYDELDFNYSELKNIHLMTKVKSMIDNYCEHKWVRYTIYSLRCSKCEKDIWYE